MNGNGDFRSPEVQRLYDEADVIITNPPFSLLKEFVQNLSDKKKDFLIIGNKFAYSYNCFFPLFKNGFLRIGYTSPKHFNHYESETKQMNLKIMSGVCWFTNLDVSYRNEELVLIKKYSPEEYQTYDGWDDIIEVNQVKNIPSDYSGRMGVPLTFLDKYNPKQFEIIAILSGYKFENKQICYVNGKKTFRRVIIKRKN